MVQKYLAVFAAVAMIAGCSTMGRLTAKNYTSKSGSRVLVAQAEPKADYACTKLAQEKQDWGFSQRMNQGAAMEKLRTTAVETAAAKGANYAYVMIPAQKSILGFNVNAFDDAQVAYYRCAQLPAA
ncbi:MAG TPA: hypothetical protein VFK24_11225 [Gammaproteobacteria bacterium]|nr:hypothetical protein [Gammaproteobacteria bacterium]